MGKRLIRRLKTIFERYERLPQAIYEFHSTEMEHLDVTLERVFLERKFNHPNTFVRFGRKCFSQSDEDGITVEIARRLGINGGLFAEFGIDDGLENNTLVLLALGWKGFWIGSQDLAFDTAASSRLYFEKAWLTKDNIWRYWTNGIARFRADQVDLISIDVDGNDFYFVETLLCNGARPKIFIVEYNAAFIPPIEFAIEYDPDHTWKRDNYFGASLQSMVNLFKKFDYQLVCCNSATGSNAFFVQQNHLHLFPEVPEDVSQIYTPPFYHVLRKHGHDRSVKTLELILRKLELSAPDAP